ncbi:Zinc finger protein [Armadillidium vulgare]|nr:Zinc finger protein [Armadillidium vulgare]
MLDDDQDWHIAVGTNLKSHIRFKHTKEKPFHCYVCSKGFSLKANLNAHMRIHTGEKPYRCDKCATLHCRIFLILKKCIAFNCRALVSNLDIVLQIFMLDDDQDWHVGETVSEEGGQKGNYLKGSRRLLTCSYCPYRTLYATNLQRHTRFKHTKEKPFQCPVCSKRFSMKANLSIHMRIHTGEKPYRCDKCDDDQDWHNIGEAVSEEGGQKGNYLTKSRRLHTCSYCPYRTVNVTNLKYHTMFKHTKEKPFQCSVCSKRFSMKSNLNKHMRIHTGEKPYQCDKCDMRFAQKIHLRYHQQRKKSCGN